MPDETTTDPNAFTTTKEGPDVTFNIAPVLFKSGVLINSKFSAWTGTVSLKDADQVIQGTRSDNSFFKKGSVMLVPSAELKPFSQRRAKFEGFLMQIAREFPIPHSRMIMRSDIELVKRECQKCQADYTALTADFVQKYPNLATRRREEFNARYPEFAGRLDAYFPSIGAVAKKFGFSRVFYEVTDIGAMDAIEAEERDGFRNKMRNYLHEIAVDVRRSAVEAALAFREGVEGAKTVVGDRSIRKFKTFLERFESQEFMGDLALREQIVSMKKQMFEIGDWKVKDNESFIKIREQLDKIVEIGKNEGEATEVAREFVRINTGAEVDFDPVPMPEMSEGRFEFEPISTTPAPDATPADQAPIESIRSMEPPPVAAIPAAFDDALQAIPEAVGQ